MHHIPFGFVTQRTLSIYDIEYIRFYLNIKDSENVYCTCSIKLFSPISFIDDAKKHSKFSLQTQTQTHSIDVCRTFAY